MNTKEKKYINKLIKKYNLDLTQLKDKVLVITGASGTLGEEAFYYLSSLNLLKKIIIVNPSKERLEKSKKRIIDEFPSTDIEIVQCNFLKKEEVKNLISYLKKEKIDLFLNVSGVYHVKKELIEGIDNVMIVNFLTPSYIVKELSKENKNIKFSLVTSLSYSYFQLDFPSCLSSNSLKNTHLYANSKYLLMLYLFKLKKEEDLNITFSHPGVSSTSLFSPRHKGYSTLFYKVIVPLMNLIFMKKEKASLSFVLSLFDISLKEYQWIGPTKLFRFYGFPKVSSLKKKKFKEELMNEVYLKITDLVEDFYG